MAVARQQDPRSRGTHPPHGNADVRPRHVCCSSWPTGTAASKCASWLSGRRMPRTRHARQQTLRQVLDRSLMISHTTYACSPGSFAQLRAAPVHAWVSGTMQLIVEQHVAVQRLLPVDNEIVSITPLLRAWNPPPPPAGANRVGAQRRPSLGFCCAGLGKASARRATGSV